MSRFQRLARHLAGIGFLLALLAVPLALAGHHHDAGQVRPSEACSLCATIGHASAAALAPLPQLVPLEQAVPHYVAVYRAVSAAERAPQPARGPPAGQPSSVA